MPAFLVSIIGTNLNHFLLKPSSTVEQDPRQPIDSTESEELTLTSDTGKPSLTPDIDQARIDEQIEQIYETAEKLRRDQPSLGDTKILSRALRELRYAFKVFAPYRSRRKVVIFGSARTPPEKPSFQTGVELGRAMADAGWMVVTGAGNGIMEAGHIGAGRENSMGLNIMLPFEQSSNPVIAGDPKLVTMKYFFTRKLMFVKECDAMVLLPGGFGTLDEGLEVLTLLQTGKRDIVPLIFMDAPGGDFWKPFLKFVQDKLLGDRMISPDDQSLFSYSDNVAEVVRELKTFYRVYHSMRYVKKYLSLRLHKPIGSELLAKIQAQFSGILSGGEFVAGAALPEESDEPNLIALPRLIFQFNRRSLAKLRQLIDLINKEA
jgi:uncharacterized protein (TIGR00730 family)